MNDKMKYLIQGFYKDIETIKINIQNKNKQLTKFGLPNIKCDESQYENPVIRYINELISLDNNPCT